MTEHGPRLHDDPVTGALLASALKQIQASNPSPALREMATDLLAGRGQLHDLARTSQLAGPLQDATQRFVQFREQCPDEMFQRMTDYAEVYRHQLQQALDEEARHE
ncbi:hypothetical protein AB0B66_18820 [Catellatospora sp. NPDC049111]|uniref:hypothetical protein n=1 Tax=Catellatospora sp. NPDC049111 TaxID=3155271 RepID=UPI0034092908